MADPTRSARRPNNQKRKKRVYHRRKVCRFCADTSIEINAVKIKIEIDLFIVTP